MAVQKLCVLAMALLCAAVQGFVVVSPRILWHQKVQPLMSAHGDEELDVIPDVKQLDWRAFRANLVRRSREEGFGGSSAAAAARRKWRDDAWAHEIGVVEKGCVLLAHETLQGVFHQTAVLVLDHDDNAGTLGLILNRPTKRRIAGVPGLGRDMQAAFGQCAVHYGGPVGAGGMTALHGVKQARGGQEIAPGLYVGGFEDLVRLAQEGRVDGSSLRLAHGHAAWGPGQLSRELRADFWYLAAAAPALVTGAGAAGRAPSRMWHQLLDLMGGSYAEVARRNST
ncbi:hypothetical protein JKP88DRAFT_260925 [Tribonema minus]|uniref:Uncharacterized protein n=1 Tax=Tribonema minus TaxID=303371 RepID=A0A836CNM8_9STRA|nr:hypothetical protein JKP88DRAFT_260925 [Tribonema minus]